MWCNMKKYIEITKVKQVDDFTLLLTFNGNESKQIDFGKLLKGKSGVFEPLKDKAEFKKCSIDMAGGVSWDCGADLAADMLYVVGQKV